MVTFMKSTSREESKKVATTISEVGPTHTSEGKKMIPPLHRSGTSAGGLAVPRVTIVW